MSTTRNKVAAQAGPRKSSGKTSTARNSVADTFQPKNDPDSLKKLTFQIDVELHRQLKAIAAQEGKTMREIIEEQLISYVKAKR